MFSNPRKKKINLGGTSKTLTKEELLQKNKQEREAREMNVKREASAALIAKVFRRHMAKKAAWKRIWKMSWRNGVEGGDKVLVRAGSAAGGEATFLDVLAILLLCKADDNEFPHLASFLESIVFDWTLEDASRLSFLIPRMLTQDVYFSTRLVLSILESLEMTINAKNSSSTIPPKALARVLNCISGPSVMSHLTRILQTDGSLPKEKNDCFLIILKTMVIGYSSGVNVDQLDFIEKTMIIPGFLASVPPKFVKDFPFDALLSSLASIDFSLSTITSPQRLTIFANFLSLATVKMDSLSGREWKTYLDIINKFLADIPVPNSSRDISDQDSDEDLDMKPVSVLDEPHLQVLKTLYQSSHILKVIRAGAQNDIPKTCTFLVGIMSRFRTERLSIASIVLFQHEKTFLRNCLEYYTQSALATAIQTDILAALANPLYTSDWYCLVIVCEFYARMLLTVSNEEFFNSPESIPLELFISLTGTLKKVAFVVFWSLPLSICAPLLSVSYMQDLIPRFLSQIYAREVRRRFCPDDHWLVSSPELLATLDQIPSFMKDDQRPVGGGGGGLNERAHDRVDACRLILERIPFIISFADRVKLFRLFLASDEPGAWIAPSFRAEVRRGQVFEDGYAQLNALGSRLRERIAISFIDQHGLPEAGIDGGGVFKEFLTESLKQAFQPELGLFVETPGHLLYPSPSDYASQQEQLHLFEFLGRIIGKFVLTPC